MAVSLVSKAEAAYVRDALQVAGAVRGDGRSVLDFRPISVEPGVIPLANGSARVSIGQTQVLASTKLEPADGEPEIIAHVFCPASAYSTLAPAAIDDFQYDMTDLLQSTLSHSSLLSKNLVILPGKKSWQLNLDVVVVSDAGNIVDVVFLAARAALRDTRVPRTAPIAYKAAQTSDTASRTLDFELTDYWDEGVPLEGVDGWPLCVTLNLLPPIHFLDATPLEEAAAPHKLLLMYAFPGGVPRLHGTRLLGPGELSVTQLQSLITEGEQYARALAQAVDTRPKTADISGNVHNSSFILTLR